MLDPDDDEAMLNATRKHVSKDLVNRRIAVQEKLILLYTNNLVMINTQAALLCGFAFSEMKSLSASPPDWCGEDKAKCQAFMLTGASMHALGLASNLLSVCSSTLSSINGPGLALRGLNPESDVDQAVTGLFSGHRFALKLHMLGMLFFFLGVISGIWFRFDSASAVACTVVLVASILLFFHVYARMQRRFNLEWTAVEEGTDEPLPIPNSGKATNSSLAFKFD